MYISTLIEGGFGGKELKGRQGGARNSGIDVTWHYLWIKWWRKKGGVV